MTSQRSIGTPLLHCYSSAHAGLAQCCLRPVPKLAMQRPPCCWCARQSAHHNAIRAHCFRPPLLTASMNGAAGAPGAGSAARLGGGAAAAAAAARRQQAQQGAAHNRHLPPSALAAAGHPGTRARLRALRCAARLLARPARCCHCSVRARGATKVVAPLAATDGVPGRSRRARSSSRARAAGGTPGAAWARAGAWPARSSASGRPPSRRLRAGTVRARPPAAPQAACGAPGAHAESERSCVTRRCRA